MSRKKEVSTPKGNIECPNCRSINTRKNEEESEFDGLVMMDCLDCNHKFCPPQPEGKNDDK